MKNKKEEINMKICLNAQCRQEYLTKADEIKIRLKDLYKLIDYIDNYPNATFILYTRNIPEDTELTWKEIEQANKLCKGQFIFAATTIQSIHECIARGIKFYLDKPITTYEELYWLKKSRAEYILIEAPLFFDLENVKSICGNDCLLRIAPNIAYYANDIPRENGLQGSWIRPEDIDLYEGLIDTIEFEDCNARKEEALFCIYKEDKKWLGDIDILITNLNKSIIGKYIPKAFTKNRLNCRQKCFNGSLCDSCYRAAVLSTNEIFQKKVNDWSKKDNDE